jgi:ribosomal protein S19
LLVLVDMVQFHLIDLAQLVETLLLMALLLLVAAAVQVFTTRAFQLVGLAVDQAVVEPHQVDQAVQVHQGKDMQEAQVVQDCILAEVAVQVERQAHKQQELVYQTQSQELLSIMLEVAAESLWEQLLLICPLVDQA